MEAGGTLLKASSIINVYNLLIIDHTDLFYFWTSLADIPELALLSPFYKWNLNYHKSNFFYKLKNTEFCVDKINQSKLSIDQ